MGGKGEGGGCVAKLPNSQLEFRRALIEIKTKNFSLSYHLETVCTFITQPTR